MFFQVQVHQIICIIIILTEWCSKYINVLMCHYMLNEHQHLYIVHIHVGNHTFAAIRGCESYQLIGALSEVIGEVNSLITSQSLPAVPGVMFEVVLGGDYKVQYLHILYNVTYTGLYAHAIRTCMYMYNYYAHKS